MDGQFPFRTLSLLSHVEKGVYNVEEVKEDGWSEGKRLVVICYGLGQ